MPRNSTFPTLFEDIKKLSLKRLKEFGYLDKDQRKAGTINWSRKGEVYSSISLYSYMDLPKPYIVLDYTKRNEKFNYVVNLLFVPSNLGEGEILYFECPKTKKRCRNLYLIGDYFTHREAYKSTYYEKQTYSKSSRDLDRFYASFHEEEKARLEINSKHFKKFYNGQPTKRYKRLFSIIRKCENYIKSEFYTTYR